MVRGFIEENYIDVVRTPKLGVTVANLTDYLTEHPEEASRFDTGAQGIVVIGFDPTRNAMDVLEEYDLIIKINGTTVTTIDEMLVFFTYVEFGDLLSVTVVRKEGTSFVEYTYDIELA